MVSDSAFGTTSAPAAIPAKTASLTASRFWRRESFLAVSAVF